MKDSDRFAFTLMWLSILIPLLIIAVKVIGG